MSVQAQQEERELLEQINALPGRSGHVLRMRYGLYDGEEKTFREIGEQLGVTRERARQLHTQGMRKLKKRYGI